MSAFVETVLSKLAKNILDNPFLSIMVLNKKLDVVWHNERFAEEMNEGRKIENMKCYEVLGNKEAHKDCPLMKSITKKVNTKGFLDSEDRNFLFLTIPLDEEHAAKIHIFLPKQADNQIIEK
ncbi:MAG: hypothetical protein JXA60_06385 [Candidatus Coatesbacteria bacterium]|nr:hypothetical protein [Candidatus Coatesbacteria bacterium]